MVKIDELRESDLEALARLYKQFWGEESSLPAMRSTFGKLKDDPDYLFLVARRDEGLAGSVMGIVCRELYGECRPFLVVEDVIVDRDFRRQGIGSLLMRELESRAVGRHGCTYVLFVTERDRSEAHQFYGSLGYSKDAYQGFKKRFGQVPSQP